MTVERLPLTTLLSQALVAFTIEFDNEAEHRMPHYRVTRGSAGTRDGPWLVSMVMWCNCMRWLGETPLPVHELERRARTRTNLQGMRRWRYVSLEPEPDDARRKPPESALLVRATKLGRMAQQVWSPLVPIIEDRWAQRWGSKEIDALRTSLCALVSHCRLDLPDCLPTLGCGLWSAGPLRPPFAPSDGGSDDCGDLTLATLFARALLMIAVDFEARSRVSLAIFADVLRVLDEEPVPIRDLPRRSGVSKAAISMAIAVLVKRGLAGVDQDPSGARGKVATLTPKGSRSRSEHARLLQPSSSGWSPRPASR